MKKSTALYILYFLFFDFNAELLAKDIICKGDYNICGNDIHKFISGYTAEDVRKIVSDAIEVYNENYDIKHRADAEAIRNLTIAVTALAQGKVKATKHQIDAAFSALQKGDFSVALSLFEKEDERFDKKVNDKLRAEIKINIGILSILNDTKKSIKAYRNATRLNPGNIDSWNIFGILLHRAGELDEALNVYHTVLRLEKEKKNQLGIAAAYGNLGVIYTTRGDLDKSFDFYNKALRIYESFGFKGNATANHYNIINVYKDSKNLDKTVHDYEKALEITKNFDSKEDLANQYGNLGLLYEKNKDYKKAHEYWEKSFALLQALGNPNAKVIQNLLNKLPPEK